MNGNPLVSVILAVYNREKYVKHCLDSVINQTYSNLQIIVVDDGSTDKTVEVVREFHDDRIEIYTLGSNYHISYATNVGLDKVRGDYVAIVDSDDCWHPEKIQIQLDYLSEHPEHQGCFTWADIIDKNGDIQNEKYPAAKILYACSTDTREEWLRFFFFRGNRLSNPSSLVTAAAAKKVGKHNLFYIQAQDMEWWVRFTKNFSFGVIEQPLTYMRITDGENESGYDRNYDHKFFRFYNEMMELRYRMLDDMDDELFIRTFKDYFVCADAKTEEELKIEKAFLLLKSFESGKAPSALAFLKLEDLINDPKTAAVLDQKYHFRTRQLGEWTGKNVYFDARSEDACRKADELENVKKELFDTKARLRSMEADMETAMNGSFLTFKKIAHKYKK